MHMYQNKKEPSLIIVVSNLFLSTTIQGPRAISCTIHVEAKSNKVEMWSLMKKEHGNENHKKNGIVQACSLKKKSKHQELEAHTRSPPSSLNLGSSPASSSPTTKFFSKAPKDKNTLRVIRGNEE